MLSNDTFLGLCVAILLLAAEPSSGATCSDIDYSSPNLPQMMQNIAISSGIGEHDYTRYHWPYINYMCNGNYVAAQSLVDSGSVSQREAYLLANELGLGREYAEYLRSTWSAAAPPPISLPWPPTSLDGYCLDLGYDHGCTGRFLPFEGMAVRFCESTCTLTNPVAVRGMDAVLYDTACLATYPNPPSWRVMIYRQMTSDTEATLWWVDANSSRPINRCSS